MSCSLDVPWLVVAFEVTSDVHIRGLASTRCLASLGCDPKGKVRVPVCLGNRCNRDTVTQFLYDLSFSSFERRPGIGVVQVECTCTEHPSTPTVLS